jgi:transcriptional regulator with XRE-family HTH domain
VYICVVSTQRRMAKADGWAGELHKRVALAVKHARERQGVSAQQLADTTANLGFPITRNTLTNYENGRKQSLDVAELVVLAMALDVPPIMLLFGGHPDDPIEVTPGHAIPTVGALAWFSGDERMATGALAQQDSYEAKLLTLIRQRAEKSLMMWSAKRGAMGFIGTGDEELLGPALDRASKLSDELLHMNVGISDFIAGEEIEE